MSLIKCPECKKKISNSASNCPNCGFQLTAEKLREIKQHEAKIMKVEIITGVIVAIVGGILLVPVMDFLTKPQPQTASEVRSKQIERHFSPWDGSHRELTKLITETMDDPKSYEHVSTRYWDKGDYLLVETTFRGKNAFGGTVKSQVTAKVDLEGNVIDIISSTH